MLEWINTHGLLTLIVYWAFANAVGAMPSPGATSSSFYQWAYKFLNGMLQVIAANSARLPMVRNLLGMSSTTEDQKAGQVDDKTK